MAFALIINLAAAIALAPLLTATMRLPYRLSVVPGARPRRARPAAQRWVRPVTPTRRSAHPDPELT